MFGSRGLSAPILATLLFSPPVAAQDADSGECWEAFMPLEEDYEEEPNDTPAEQMLWEIEGGDLELGGSTHTCAGAEGDIDRIQVITPGCGGRAFFGLDWTALDSIFEFSVMDAEGAIQATALGAEPGGPVGVEAEVGSDFVVEIVCRAGSPANWTLSLEWLGPGEVGGFPEEETTGCGCATLDRRVRPFGWMLGLGLPLLWRSRRRGAVSGS